VFSVAPDAIFILLFCAKLLQLEYVCNADNTGDTVPANTAVDAEDVIYNPHFTARTQIIRKIKGEMRLDKMRDMIGQFITTA